MLDFLVSPDFSAIRSASTVEHCSEPRGYPRKIFSDVLTNMHTTKKEKKTLQILQKHVTGEYLLLGKYEQCENNDFVIQKSATSELDLVQNCTKNRLFSETHEKYSRCVATENPGFSHRFWDPSY